MEHQVNERNDGGPAFPQDGGCEQLESPYLVQGMSLRDYFAAKAMQRAMAPNIAGFSSYTPDWPAMARECYEIADAMLKARQS